MGQAVFATVGACAFILIAVSGRERRKVKELFGIKLERIVEVLYEFDNYSYQFMDGEYSLSIRLTSDEIARLRSQPPSWSKDGWIPGRNKNLAASLSIEVTPNLVSACGLQGDTFKIVTLDPDKNLAHFELREY